MEDNYLDNGELTFRKIGQKLKAAWLRIVVYILIAAIVMGAVLAIIGSINPKQVYSAKVLFSNDSINDDMEPWDTSLSITQDVKSTAVVGKALDDIGVDAEDKFVMMPIVISNLVVNPEFSDKEDKDKKKVEINNFMFTISLEGDKDLELSPAKTQELLDAICNNYVLMYKNKYALQEVQLEFDTATTAFNYIYAAQIIDDQLTKASLAANNMAKVAPDFKGSTSQSFSLLAAEFNILKNQLKAVKSYLSINGVEKANSSNNKELDYINQELSMMEAKMKALDAQVSLLDAKSKELADSITSSITPGTQPGSVIINSNQKEYLELVEQMMAKREALDSVDAQIKFLNQLKNGFAPLNGDLSKFAQANDEQKKEMQNIMDTYIKDIVDKGNALEVELNKCVLEYNEFENLKEAVKVVQSTKKTTTRLVSTIVFLAVEVVTVIIAFIVAMAVTNKKGKLYFKKKAEIEAAKKVEESDKADKE